MWLNEEGKYAKSVDSTIRDQSWRTFKYKADNDDGAPWRRVLGGAGTVIRVGALCHRWVSDPSQAARYVTPIPQIDPPTVTR